MHSIPVFYSGTLHAHKCIRIILTVEFGKQTIQVAFNPASPLVSQIVKCCPRALGIAGSKDDPVFLCYNILPCLLSSNIEHINTVILVYSYTWKYFITGELI